MLRKPIRHVEWIPVTATVGPDRVEITGAYSIVGRTLTVRMDGGGEKSTGAGAAPNVVARIMLRELYDQENA